MITLECPHCGRRNANEFRYGSEYNPRPKKPAQCNAEEWAEYVYYRDNRLGVQKEWWHHSVGCGRWFLAERHTLTNKVEKTFLWQPSDD